MLNLRMLVGNGVHVEAILRALPQHQEFLDEKPASSEAATPAGRTLKNVWPMTLSLIVFQNSQILGITGICVHMSLPWNFVFLVGGSPGEWLLG